MLQHDTSGMQSRVMEMERTALNPCTTKCLFARSSCDYRAACLSIALPLPEQSAPVP